VLLVCLLTSEAHSQSSPDYEEWIKKLSSTRDDRNEAFKELSGRYLRDSSASVIFYNELERRNFNPNDYFKARLHTLQLHKTIALHQYASKSEIIVLAQQAVNEAYATEDEHLVACISFECGALLAHLGELERAAAFLLKGQEMLDRLGGQTIRDQYMNYTILGETLFHCREYQKSIFYTRRVIDIYNDTASDADSYRARFYNTVGQNYLKLEMLDSAMSYFDTSLQISIRSGNVVWKGINAGFIGQVLYQKHQVDQAKPFLELAYVTLRDPERDHAGKALQFLARIDLEQGKIDSARLKCTEALAILRPLGQTHYLQAASFLELAYNAAADIYRAAKMTDSFYHYNHLYTQLHDSIQSVALLSSNKIAQLRIDNDNNYRTVGFLKREKRAEEARRNYLIVAILLVTVIVFLYLKRLRLKQRHKEELALREKQAAEAELHAAKEQMKLFTQNIVEKTDLIDKLTHQISNKELSDEQLHIVDEITHRTILTEAEWEHFKSLFEKVHPGFFSRLKEKAHDVTIAEQRMAALTRLNLTARQMASILGISVDSVHKTRQRLRQRLHIPAEVNLEQSVSAF
jgi:tetratricopeptide (TPR) repeat protein/DNA-binding CsgD family transcriptional regulator